MIDEAFRQDATCDTGSESILPSLSFMDVKLGSRALDALVVSQNS